MYTETCLPSFAAQLRHSGYYRQKPCTLVNLSTRHTWSTLTSRSTYVIDEIVVSSVHCKIQVYAHTPTLLQEVCLTLT
jgi:hypothetical protein